MWNSEERFRLEIRVKVQVAFEGLEQVTPGRVGSGQGPGDPAFRANGRCDEVSIKRRIRRGGALEAKAGARGGEKPWHQHHQEVPEGKA